MVYRVEIHFPDATVAWEGADAAPIWGTEIIPGWFVSTILSTTTTHDEVGAPVNFVVEVTAEPPATSTDELVAS